MTSLYMYGDSRNGYHRWEAFIFYAYFDRVSFAPLTSHKGPHTPPKPFEPPPCSPKSMYRFADKVYTLHFAEAAFFS